MIDRIEQAGMIVYECGLAGERRADDVFPGHPNGLQVSRDTWLLVYATRGWRGVDDDRSIVYQLRRDAPNGKLIREGMVRQSINDWDPVGDGVQLVRQLGHPVAFGVPKGALIHGRPAPHANLFAIKWRVTARYLNPETGALEGVREHSGLRQFGQFVEWMQCRLNDAGDDIEIVAPPRMLRQAGFEDGPQFCSSAEPGWMNQAFSQAVPFNADATEWVDCNHFEGGRVAALKYRFNPTAGLYEWVETGPYMQAPGRGVNEASVARLGDSWIVCARSDNAIGWVRTDDPFRRMPEPAFTTSPAINAPVTFYTCADGVPRIFTGDPVTSPYGTGRNPLYCWDIDPDTFAAGNRTEVFDCIRSGTLPGETVPRAEMCKLLPHAGGREQWLLWRVRTKNVGYSYGSLKPVTQEWKGKHGLYGAKLAYTDEYEGAWGF